MNLIELALGLELVSDSMATTRWQPPWETEDALAALDRVRAALLAGDVDVSAVMRQRSASEKDRVPGVVVAFTLRPFSGSGSGVNYEARSAPPRFGRVVELRQRSPQRVQQVRTALRLYRHYRLLFRQFRARRSRSVRNLRMRARLRKRSRRSSSRKTRTRVFVLIDSRVSASSSS